METQEEYRRRVIKTHEDAGDFVTDNDGFIKYWPEGQNGFMESFHLRWIADELDKRNKGWIEQIDRDLKRLDDEGFGEEIEYFGEF